MDTPELTRAVVVITRVLDALLTAAAVDRTTLEPQLRELDALTMRLVHRSQSAAGYHLSARGMDALEEADQVAAAIAEGHDVDKEPVQITRYRWSQSQAEGPRFANQEPEEKTTYTRDLRGAALLAPYPRSET